MGVKVINNFQYFHFYCRFDGFSKVLDFFQMIGHVFNISDLKVNKKYLFIYSQLLSR